MNPIIILASGWLVVATVCGCGASSTRPETRPDETSDAAGPPTIERQTPPHYRPIRQGTYAEAEQPEPSGGGSARLDSSRARGNQGSLAPPLLYDVPGEQEPASPAQERGDRKPEDDD